MQERCLCLRFRMVVLAFCLTVLQLGRDMPRVCPILTFLCMLLENLRNSSYCRHREQNLQGLVCSQSARNFLSEAQHLGLTPVINLCSAHGTQGGTSARTGFHRKARSGEGGEKPYVPWASLSCSDRTKPARLSPFLLWLFAAH